jgi:hypothetical protein
MPHSFSRTGDPVDAGETHSREMRLRALHDQAKQGLANAQNDLGAWYCTQLATA